MIKMYYEKGQRPKKHELKEGEEAYNVKDGVRYTADKWGNVVNMAGGKDISISGQITSATVQTGPKYVEFQDFFVNEGGITYDAGKFYVPEDGLYRVTFNGLRNASVTATSVYIGINEDTPVHATHGGSSYSNETTAYSPLVLNSVVHLYAGQYVGIYLKVGSLYASAIAYYGQFSITKVSNSKVSPYSTSDYVEPDPAPVDLALLNGWVSYGSSYGTPQVFRDGKTVSIQGLVKDGTITTGTLVATLPVGYRPNKRLLLSTYGGAGVARFDVDTDGSVYTNSGFNATFTSICVTFIIE